MKFFLVIVLIFLTLFQLTAQDKKAYTITRTGKAPKIDGVLDDNAWKDTQIATDFVQFRPTAGKTMPNNKRTEVKMAYDDSGIYISAYLYDNPEDMMKQFTQRDDFGQSDFFGVFFNTNNDAQNNTKFFVFSSGTQADATEIPGNGENFGWNAVWKSATKTVANGWIVEIMIPYRALRFTQQENPTWGIQFHRHYRNTREQNTWNPIDITSGAGNGFFNGELNGLKNLKPPTRLSFYPFASYVGDRFDGAKIDNFNAGLDIKYGVTENFTLDATLIPDFSQVGFDNMQLNLGPFEQTFPEQRQFFTEGVDLFRKGDLFFSRRIGNAPIGSPILETNEFVDGDLPQKTALLNAVKVSGRTKSGLGVGFFNAITKKTDVDVINTLTGKKRSETIEPLTNYNIMVVDQQFNKNSSVTLINTNVTRNGSGNSLLNGNKNSSGARDANVSGLLFDLKNKKNTYGAIANVKMSNLNLENITQTGISTSLAIGKNSGQYRWNVSHELADKDYDINDIGVLFRNNYSNLSTNLSYRIFEPTKKHNNFQINTWANYNRLYKPGTFTGFNFGGRFFAVTKKSLMAYGGSFNVQPGKQFDYFGPRVNGRYFITENLLNTRTFISTNYNKKYAIDISLGYETLFEDSRSYESVFFEIEPRIKFNENFIVIYSFEWDQELRERGWIDFIGNDIIYGQRDQLTIENSISGSYNFNALNSLTLSFRSYWSAVQYEDNLYALGKNGRLNRDNNYTKKDLSDPDVNFSTWNLNLTYSWQFAPGSFLTAQYRNRIFNINNNGSQAFNSSIKKLFKQSNFNTFSLKMVYFIDYNNIKNVFKGKS